MVEVVIGTAGHVDHGKTTLIKALTQIDTDTLAQEKERGISINLGFAHLDYPDGRQIGIVDVPGHERFIKNMVAGLPGLGLVLLVVDAAEGVMPQTIEHVNILTLLGIENFIVVLTKVDTVDEIMQELAVEDIKERFANTPLAEAPIILTDAISGRGIQELTSLIRKRCDALNYQHLDGVGRVNIDRVFSSKGFGTVITGTLIDGVLEIGQDVWLYTVPEQQEQPIATLKSRIRSLQSYGHQSEKAYPGQRVAVNLADVKREQLKRGDVLIASQAITPSWMLDCKVQSLKNHEQNLDLWDRVRLLIGTREVMARLVPLGQEQIVPGEEAFAQLRLEDQVSVKKGDRFILRSYSPVTTIAGGEVLDANPSKHKRFDQSMLESLKVKEEGDIESLILDFCNKGKGLGVASKELQNYLNVSKQTLLQLLADIEQQQKLIKVGEFVIPADKAEKFTRRVLQELKLFHEKYPLRVGISKEEIRQKLRQVFGNDGIEGLLSRLVTDEKVVVNGNFFRLPDFSVQLGEKEQRQKESFSKQLDRAGFTATLAEELAGSKAGLDLLHVLDGDILIFLDADYVIGIKAYRKALKLMADFFVEKEQMTLADFRDFTESSRKNSMLMLEYMDKLGITERVENYRIKGKNYAQAIASIKE